MIDAAKSFKKILKEWGHDVYIQRILANSNHSNRFERVTTRQVGQSGITNSMSTQEEDEGLVTRYDAVYYFEGSVNPKEGDRIYENYSIKTNRNYSMFRIDAATAVRGKFGKIVYWIVGASRER
jgi:oxalate decarboxylase/phosphoglucose isomerase-like protein (cupin superfamily)